MVRPAVPRGKRAGERLRGPCLRVRCRRSRTSTSAGTGWCRRSGKRPGRAGVRTGPDHRSGRTTLEGGTRHRPAGCGRRRVRRRVTSRHRARAWVRGTRADPAVQSRLPAPTGPIGAERGPGTDRRRVGGRPPASDRDPARGGGMRRPDRRVLWPPCSAGRGSPAWCRSTVRRGRRSRREAGASGAEGPDATREVDRVVGPELSDGSGVIP